jgi:putative ABC transport system permease protein
VSVFRANVKEAYRSLITAKQRTVLAVIGIVIGIGSVIGMVSIGGIVRAEALRQFMDMGVDVVMLTRSYQAQSTGRGFDLAAARELPGRGLGILEVAPFVTSADACWSRGKSQFFQMFGVTPSFFAINKLRAESGRLLMGFDDNRPFCVVGERAAASLRRTGRRELLGESLQIGDRLYTVVGELAPVVEGGGMRPGGLNDAILVPISTALRFWPNAEINQVLARVEGKGAAASLRADLQRHFSRSSKGLQFEVRTAEEIIAAMEKQMALYTLLLGAIGSIALIVGGIGVMNVMLISVSERRSEIGVRRALGAQRTDIQMQFIVESIALCAVGGLLGVLTGVGVSFVFARLSKYAFGISGTAILLGFVVSTVVGLFFGYYPARKAANLDPINALRATA